MTFQGESFQILLDSIYENTNRLNWAASYWEAFKFTGEREDRDNIAASINALPIELRGFIACAIQGFQTEVITAVGRLVDKDNRSNSLVTLDKLLHDTKARKVYDSLPQLMSVYEYSSFEEGYNHLVGNLKATLDNQDVKNLVLNVRNKVVAHTDINFNHDNLPSYSEIIDAKKLVSDTTKEIIELFCPMPVKDGTLIPFQENFDNCNASIPPRNAELVSCNIKLYEGNAVKALNLFIEMGRVGQ